MLTKLYKKIKLLLSYMLGHKRQVAAAIIEKDSKILIAKRRKTDTLGGKWEFPGGKVEPGETPEACLRRELKEEFGVDTEIGEFFTSTRFIYYLVPIDLLSYHVRHLSGEFKTHDHDEIAWVSADKLQEYDLVKADRPIARALLTFKDQGSKIFK